MKNGSNAGFAVFDHKEPILKGINCKCMYVSNVLNHSHYFWDRHSGQADEWTDRQADGEAEERMDEQTT
jgi:hypothetical protein